MRPAGIAAALGLLMAVVFGVLAWTQVDKLRTSGLALSDNINGVFNPMTLFFMLIAVVVLVILFVGVFAKVFSGR